MGIKIDSNYWLIMNWNIAQFMDLQKIWKKERKLLTCQAICVKLVKVGWLRPINLCQHGFSAAQSAPWKLNKGPWNGLGYFGILAKKHVLVNSKQWLVEAYAELTFRLWWEACLILSLASFECTLQTTKASISNWV